MRARVASLIAVAAVSVCAFAQTTTCPTQPATLQSPANFASSVASPIHFDWSDVAGATGYRLWASFGGGTPNVIALTQDSQYDVNVPAGNVEWWVDALADNCAVQTSAHFTFTAAGGTATCPANPAAPKLNSPANGATGLGPRVTLSWSAVTGATEYRIYVQVNGTPAVILGTTSFTQVANAFPSGTVSWFVEAVFPGCPSTFSGVSTFTVANGSACSTTPTTLVAPANNASVQSPVTLQWSAVPGAVGYKVYLSAGTTASDLAGITTDTTLTRIVGNGTFTWRVDTMYAGCPDVPSAQSSFTVAPANSCSGSITLLKPLEASNVNSPVTMTWTPIQSATAYRIWASINGGPPAVIARSNNASQTVAFPSGDIEWWIEALFAQCDSILSPQGHFTVNRATTCSSNQPPVLVSPIKGAQEQNPVNFNWNATPGALLYRVWVSDDGEPFEDVGVTTATHFNATVDPGNIQWYVETLFSGCDPVDTPQASFTIPAPPRCQNGTTLLISPASGSNDQTAPVTLVWSAVPGATEYRVFAKINGSNRLLLDRTAGTSSTKMLVPGSTEWWVESDFDGCPGTLSTHSTFTIPKAANCSTAGPTLVSPASAATNVGTKVTFAWNPLSGAIGYVLWVRHNGDAPTRLAETSNTSFVQRVPEGSFQWWVVAFFASCPPTVSTHATFTTSISNCSNRAPILMSPASGAINLTSPLHLAWTAVPNATSYKVWAAVDDQDPSVIATTTNNKLVTALPSGSISWYVEAQFASCPTTTSATSTFSVLKAPPPCDTPDQPVASVAAQVASGTPYTVQWTPVANATNYELVESTNPAFTGAKVQVVSDVSITLSHTTGAQPTRYFYRVRADSSCADVHGPYSKIVSILILPVTAQSTIDVGTTSGATQQIQLPPHNPPATFSAHADKPWITVSPSTGTVGPQGATLTVTYDPSGLKLGSNSGSITITYGGGAGKIATNGVSPVLPVSVSLVTPVMPQGSNTPSPDTLIVPAIASAPGANGSVWQSDIRLANTSAQAMQYQLNFTLTQTDGTLSGQSTTVDVSPGQTLALNDIVSNFFAGAGTSSAGMLQIRPLTSSTSNGFTTTPSVQTVASSRTYDVTQGSGTFGQFIPSIPFSQFVGQGGTISLQQVAQSSEFRTNLGLVEGSGSSAQVLIQVFDNNGNQLAQIPQSLLPGEHLQLNNFLQANNISLTDGRIAVQVTSATGKVSAYASVVDNLTNDPLVVFPVTVGSVSSTNYVVPGVADISNGFANWQTDMRLFNSGTSPVTATLTYSPQPGSSGAQKSVSLSIQPGQVYAANSTLQSLFGISNTGGAMLISTPSASGLVVTARTYNKLSSGGTFGQFIPAVTPADGIGNGDPSLNILQLEESSDFYSNVGLAELTGNAPSVSCAGLMATACVQLTAYTPDSKVAATVNYPLGPSEFVQLGHILAQMYPGESVYNARMSIQVIGGTGRVTAYGSVIDQTSTDPTYVPAQ